MHRLKVLQILPELKSGGVERGTLEIASALVRAGHSAFVCSAGGPMVTELEALGARHLLLHSNSKNPLRMFANIFALRKLIQENNIQIIHARSRAPAWSAFFAAKMTGIAFVTTFHGTYNATNLLKIYYNSIMLKGDKVIAVSNYIKKHIETKYHFLSDKLTVVPRGVDLDYFCPDAVSEDRKKKMQKHLGVKLAGKVILLPARFARWKGHIYLLNALQYLRGKSFTCLLVGDVSDRHHEYKLEIEKLIEEYNLKNKVHIIPAVSDMPALYSLADIVISASQEPEAFGRTVTEAQAMKKIVIATNIGAPLETIVDGKTGYLVDYNNPSSLSDTLNELLDKSEKELKTMQQSARKNVEHSFSLQTMCDKTIAVYNELV
jgi:glycosyltransferase involved in cell wall biosynthesis